MKKRIIIIITIMIILVLSLIVNFRYNNGFRVKIREAGYSINPSAENLAKLGGSVAKCDDYNMKIKYLPMVLEDEEAFIWVKNNGKGVVPPEAWYDSLQIDYCFAYLQKGDNEMAFKEFNRLFYNFKSGADKYTYINAFLVKDKYTDEQLKIVLKAIESVYDLESADVKEFNMRLANLGSQMFIYGELNDTQGQAEVQKKMDTLQQEVRSILEKEAA